MKLISWNTNGIRACMGKGFVESMTAQDADIICIQETKMQEGQAEVPLEGYHQYWCSAEKKGYSGTAVFSKEEPISVSYGIGVDVHDHEGRVITAEYSDFYLVNVYVPNSQSELKRLDYRMQWEDDFRNYLMELDAKKPVIICGDMNKNPSSCTQTQKRKPIIVCGDFNVAANPIDIKNPKANEKNAGYTIQERTAFKNLLDAGFVDSYRLLNPDKVEYSWWSYRFKARERNAGWRLDYFLVSEFAKNMIVDAKIHTNIMGSDHCPVSLEIEFD